MTEIAEPHLKQAFPKEILAQNKRELDEAAEKAAAALQQAGFNAKSSALKGQLKKMDPDRFRLPVHTEQMAAANEIAKKPTDIGFPVNSKFVYKNLDILAPDKLVAQRVHGK